MDPRTARVLVVVAAFDAGEGLAIAAAERHHGRDGWLFFYLALDAGGLRVFVAFYWHFCSIQVRCWTFWRLAVCFYWHFCIMLDCCWQYWRICISSNLASINGARVRRERRVHECCDVWGG